MTKVNQEASKTSQAMWQIKPCHQGSGKLLTAPQRTALHTLRQTMWTEMRPLIKEKQALRLQLMGKIATPNIQWREIEVVLNKVNENNAKITTLRAKTQFTTFQKLGVTFPLHHQHRSYSHHEHRGYNKRMGQHHQYC